MEIATEVKEAQQLAKSLAEEKDEQKKKLDIARIVQLAEQAKTAEEKLTIISLLFILLDEVASEISRIISTLPIPAVNSAEDGKLQSGMRRMLGRLWDCGDQFSSQVCDITRVCIKSFQSRILGADTFEYGDYVHTSKLLGRGTEGMVHLGFQISQNGRRVAIKTVERKLIDEHNWEGPLEKGFTFLRKANHPAIVKLFHVQKLDTCWYVYMEHIDGGDLKSFLCKQDPSSKAASVRVVLSEAKAKEIFRKLVEPVAYLRRSYVIHRDLKPANFMLTRSGEVKLVDFATMRDSVESGGLAQSVKGTPAYMAPEIWLSSKIKYDGEKVDVWSMGVILYEMVCGGLPWEGADIRTLLKNVNTQPLRIPPSLGLSKEICDLLVHTLKVDPRFRMTWHELEGHEWLADDPMAGVGNFMEEAVNQLQLTVERLQLKCKTMEQAAENKDNVIRELSRELKQHRDEANVQTEQRLQELRQQIDKQRDESQHQVELRMAEARQQALWAEEAKWKNELSLRDGVIEGLRADVEANRSQYGNATKNLFAVQAQLASVTSELAVGQKREEDLKEKILLATRQVVQLRESAGAAQKMQEELVQLRQSQAQLFAMQQRVVNAEREGVECRKVTDELKVERDHLRGMVEDLVGNLSKSADGHDLREHVKELERHLEVTQQELRERNAEVESLRADISTLKFLVEESNNMH